MAVIVTNVLTEEQQQRRRSHAYGFTVIKSDGNTVDDYNIVSYLYRNPFNNNNNNNNKRFNQKNAKYEELRLNDVKSNSNNKNINNYGKISSLNRNRYQEERPIAHMKDSDYSQEYQRLRRLLKQKNIYFDNTLDLNFRQRRRQHPTDTYVY
ncbi:GATA zinc finger domain-containing protein 15-like [Oppia nitens]|uniref:GATA zinc finger domain-containing protein 15-like n=1 Tax=Oppia nitens TaxID=1686743 RepID=UPI0023DBD4CA|nr:GATA zinc finger domain-containing protein 15-like [Oppia nitens]